MDTASELRAAADSGNRVVLTDNGTYDIGGKLDLPSNFTIERAPGTTGVIKGGLFLKGVSNVVIRDLAIRPTDTSGSAGDLDAITLNGLNGSVDNVMIAHVTAIWGPDIGGIAILGDVNDVTVECSILGEGVRFSEHHEGDPPEGHSMGLSVFQLRTTVDPADRMTFVLNLLTTSDRRMPVIHGGRQIDFINNVSYNFGRNGPDGNPRGLNFIGNVIKAGPVSELPATVWRARPHSANPCCYPESVYLADNIAVGFPYSVEASSSVLRSSPAHPPSVTAMPVGQVTDFIAAHAGPTTRDATDERLIRNFLEGTGEYMHGQNYSPHPTWD